MPIFSSCREEIFLAGMRAGLKAAQSNQMQVMNTQLPVVPMGDTGFAGKGSKGGKGGKGKGWHRRFPGTQTVHGKTLATYGDYTSLYERHDFHRSDPGEMEWSGPGEKINRFMLVRPTQPFTRNGK